MRQPLEGVISLPWIPRILGPSLKAISQGLVQRKFSLIFKVCVFLILDGWWEGWGTERLVQALKGHNTCHPIAVKCCSRTIWSGPIQGIAEGSPQGRLPELCSTACYIGIDRHSSFLRFGNPLEPSRTSETWRKRWTEGMKFKYIKSAVPHRSVGSLVSLILYAALTATTSHLIKNPATFITVDLGDSSSWTVYIICYLWALLLSCTFMRCLFLIVFFLGRPFDNVFSHYFSK